MMFRGMQYTIFIGLKKIVSEPGHANSFGLQPNACERKWFKAKSWWGLYPEDQFVVLKKENFRDAFIDHIVTGQWLGSICKLKYRGELSYAHWPQLLTSFGAC